MQKKIIAIVLLYVFNTFADIYLLIPGTWAPEDGWHTPGNKFYQTLQRQLTPSDKILPYYWRGNNSHTSRAIAGKQLMLLLNALPENEKIFIIAHSHGGNVALLACTDCIRSIEALCLLGTPIDTQAYPVNYATIKRCYNLFSWEDLVQPVFGFFQRTIPEHEQSINSAVQINGKEPSHAELHNSILAEHLPKICTLPLTPKQLTLEFTTTTYRYYENLQFEEQLEIDQAFLLQLSTISRKRKAKALGQNATIP